MAWCVTCLVDSGLKSHVPCCDRSQCPSGMNVCLSIARLLCSHVHPNNAHVFLHMNKHLGAMQLVSQAAVSFLQPSLWQLIIPAVAEFPRDRGILGWDNTEHSRSSRANPVNPVGGYSWLGKRKPFSFGSLE